MKIRDLSIEHTERINKYKTIKYKLRAECANDVAQFILNAHSQMSRFKMQKDEELPDVEFEFETELTYDEIIMTLQDIDDSHVMYETVQPIEKYTGVERMISGYDKPKY